MECESFANQFEDRICELSRLLSEMEKCKAQCSHIKGLSKLRRKIKSDYEFLSQMLNEDVTKCRPSHVTCTNTAHLRGIWEKCVDPTCKVDAVFCKMHDVVKDTHICVEVVADSGSVWMKVIGATAKSLHYRWCCEEDPHIFTVANRYIQMANANKIMFKRPKVVFYFTSGVPLPIYNHLNAIGVQVLGNILHFNEIASVPHEALFHSDKPECKSESVLYNLDLTALFAYVSEMTNGGCHRKYMTLLLEEQAKCERISPVLPILDKLFKDGNLMICESAYQSFQSILDTVGGEKEKKRAAKLMQNVKIMPDKISERCSVLKGGNRIKDRSRTTFGSGDYYEAITVTANRKFVSAAQHQGVSFAVVLHEARALAEQKQLECD